MAAPRGQELRCEKLCFGYDRQRRVLTDFSYSFKPGITLLKGYSGSGKTTLLKLLAGYLKADSGRIIAPSGHRVTGRYYRRVECSYMFQGINLLPLMSVERNLQLAAAMAAMPKREWVPRCRRLLEQLGIDALRHRRADKLSGGQMQRAALARTLMKNTPIVLLDEPTSGLDDENTRIICELVEQDAAERICIISTHDSRLLDLGHDILDFDKPVSR